jgi:hypothetical protein
LAASVALTTSSCGKVERDTVVQGRLELSTFPTRPTAVRATTETGASRSFSLGENGAFRLPLAPGHRYTLDIVSAERSAPLIFPRATALFDRTFRVTGPNATVDLGRVSCLPSAPASFAFSAEAQAGDREAVRIDDETREQCGDEEEREREGDEHEESKASEASEPESKAVDGDVGVASADPSAPMAVAEHNAPENIGNCGQQGEFEGEHED